MRTPNTTPNTGTNPPLARRRFLQTFAGLGLGTLAGLSATPLRAASSGDAWHSSFAPWDAPGFEGFIETPSLPMTGTAPKALRGRFYRNGPARFGRGAQRLNHWFDGDAMVQMFQIDGARVRHRGRMLDTAKSRAEAAQGRFLYNGVGSQVRGALPLQRPDDANPANINLLTLNGGRSLYALWEAGSALQIDPDDLRSIGPKVWSPETAGAPFSAHPRVAADGSVWSFGYLPGSGRLLIYHIGANGQLRRQQVLKVPNADMVHDFAITERHLIFLLQPLRTDLGQANAPHLLATMQWDAEAPLLACVVSQADFSVRWIELPNGGLFHIGNAWEEGRGSSADTLHLGYVHHSHILGALRSFDVSPGFVPAEDTPTRWTELVLQPAEGRARVIDTGLSSVEFPRHDPRRTGQRSRLTVMLQRGQALQNETLMGFNRVLVRDGERHQGFDYGSGWLAEEHVLVPHPQRTDERAGWLLGTAYHWPTETTTLSVFAAAGVADGPLAQWRLPYGLPLGLHGQFVAA
jgi:carotenoid cleavage dioxygenase-like enzyme